MKPASSSKDAAQKTLNIAIDADKVIAPPAPSAALLLQRAAGKPVGTTVLAPLVLAHGRLRIGSSMAFASLLLLFVMNVVSIVASLRTSTEDNGARSVLTTMRVDSTKLSLRDVMQDYHLSDQSFSPLSTSNNE